MREIQLAEARGESSRMRAFGVPMQRSQVRVRTFVRVDVQPAGCAGGWGIGIFGRGLGDVP